MGIGKISGFQINEYMTLEDSVVENQIHPIMFIANCYPFLPSFKAKPCPHFQ